MIAIVDYGMGNLGSIKKKMDKFGVKSIITSNSQDIKSCNKIILPGVGHFAKAVFEIKKRGLWDLLSEQVLIEKRYILGICLGMQLMAKYSEEGYEEGFGWFDAKVIRFRVSDKAKYKIPHTGWNTTTILKNSPLFEKIGTNSEFYFVHSYHIQCDHRNDILSETIYDYPFTSAIQKGNIIGVQFHPEKSHDAGDLLLRNFIEM